tara:strand:- start:2365 stop:3249 length:885 start_codon:yes stop_codon:yes gene_type:complete
MKILYIRENSKALVEYNLNTLKFIVVACFSIFSVALLGYFVGYQISSHKFSNEIISLKQNESIYLSSLSDLEKISLQLEDVVKKDNLLRDMIGLPQIDLDVYKMGTGGLSRPDNFKSNSNIFEIINYLKKITTLQKISYNDISKFVNDNLEKVLSIPAIHPVNMSDCKMSSGFGKRMHPKLNRMHMHEGHDFAPISNFWNTEVFATANGIVKKSINLPKTYGQYIEIDHGDGIVTAYAHLRVRNVRKGQKVKRGQKIGVMGSTGMSTSVHLHYEVKKNGKAVNPYNYYFDYTSF